MLKSFWTIKAHPLAPSPGLGSAGQEERETERDTYWIRPWHQVGGKWDEQGGKQVRGFPDPVNLDPPSSSPATIPPSPSLDFIRSQKQALLST